MDPRFHNKVVEQLVRPLADETAGRMPDNPELAQAVHAVIRKQNPGL